MGLPAQPGTTFVIHSLHRHPGQHLHKHPKAVNILTAFKMVDPTTSNLSTSGLSLIMSTSLENWSAETLFELFGSKTRGLLEDFLRFASSSFLPSSSPSSSSCLRPTSGKFCHLPLGGWGMVSVYSRVLGSSWCGWKECVSSMTTSRAAPRFKLISEKHEQRSMKSKWEIKNK